MNAWISFTFLFLLLPTHSLAKSSPTFSYDLGVSSGTYNEKSYSEIQLGLSWYLEDYLVWRNSVFHRFGTGIDSSTGLDTSARLVYNSSREPDELGFGVFAGPGLRLSKKESTGVFGEAGITLKGPGFAVGVVGKSIHYFSPLSGEPKNDTVISLLLAVGGAF